MQIIHQGLGAAPVPHGAIEITPDDAVDLTRPIRKLMVRIAGDVMVRYEDGSEIPIVCLPGVQYDCEGAVGISATGTTAVDGSNPYVYGYR